MWIIRPLFNSFHNGMWTRHPVVSFQKVPTVIFYDFEVFKYDWLAVFIDPFNETKTVIINDPNALSALYEDNSKTVWVGYNNRHYDQYIFKGILLGMDPKPINDYIIVAHGEGWQYSTAFNGIPMINYDVMPNPPVGLKAVEGFLGVNIKETEVPFDIDRKLTQEEIEQTVFYCTTDVENTIRVFLEKVDDFNAMKDIVQAFPEQVNLGNIGDSEARITARVLGCQKRKFDDEFDYFFLPCIRLNKYQYVMDWFRERQEEIKYKLELNREVARTGQGFPADEFTIKKDFYKQSLTTTVAGIPHTFGFGGLHGATEKPCHRKGAIYHVDVNNYYPSMLIAWGLVTRSATNDNYKNVYLTRKELKKKQQSAKTKDEAKKWKKAQLPYKKMLNALSGAMKDNTNPAYDPRNNNCMCINGQLMLLDLIEHLEAIPGFFLIQSNTDGLIVEIPNTDEHFKMLDDICYEWEQRCSTAECEILLALDCISEIFQKDVNNYLWVDLDGGVERCGDYVKELSRIDNDLPILRIALVEYMAHGIPVEKTIGDCDDLIQFQKVVKLSDKYRWVEHEHCDPVMIQTGKRVIKTNYEYPHTERYSYKCYRVFASKDMKDGRLLKCGGSRGKPEKFGNTPEHCFIFNDNVENIKVPDNLDREWYVAMAKKRLKAFGINT